MMKSIGKLMKGSNTYGNMQTGIEKDILNGIILVAAHICYMTKRASRMFASLSYGGRGKSLAVPAAIIMELIQTELQI